jgi:glycosyltransferase involved in cell wall biosynthesis
LVTIQGAGHKLLKGKRKVLLVVRWPVGGIRTFIRYVYRKFDPERWRFTIIAPDLPEMRVLMDDLSVIDVRYIPIEENPSPALFALKVAKELMWGGYNLVHSHGFTSGVCTTLSARLSRTTHLMTSHDVINENQFVGTKGKLMKQGMGRLLNLIDTIHSVSHDAENNLLLHFPSITSRNGRCVVIPNGIEIERFHNGIPRDLRGELGLDEKTFLVGFFGRFMSQKGFRYLVDAIELLRHATNVPKRPVVLTFGDGGFVREERQAIQERGLEKYFRYMPFEPNVAGVIKGLDVVAIPSLWEACPLLPMEVLSCGTPLIASDCIGLREVLRGTPSKIVPKADPIALADALAKEIRMGSKEIFKAYRFDALNRYDVNRTHLEIENLYARLT